jgi:hypothetical protein
MKRREKFANIVLIGGIILCLGAVGHTAFVSTRPPNVLRVRYIVSVAGVVVLGFASRWPLETRVNFSLAIVSLGVTVYLGEVAFYVARAKPYQPAPATPAPRKDASFDKRSRLQVIADLREEGRDAYSRVSPRDFVDSNGLGVGKDKRYPLAGISNRQTVHCNITGEWVVFESDEHGFRNPQGIYGNQDLDIVLIGDSFTFGGCVKENIGDLLRRDDRTVLNLGYSGIGPLIEMAILEEYGASLTPQVVLWIYYEGNDLDDLDHELESSFLSNYLGPHFSQGLINQQSDVDRLLIGYLQGEEAKAREAKTETERKRTPDWQCIIKLCGWRRALSSQNLSNLLDRYFPAAPPLSLFRRIMVRVNNQVVGWGGRLYFVYLPSIDRYSGVPNWDKSSYRKEVLSIVEALDIPVIDFHETISAHPDPLSLFPFRQNIHYTAQGYQLVVEQIEAQLTDDAAELFGDEQ